MKKFWTIICLLSLFNNMMAKPADPALLKRLLEEGKTERYNEMIASEKAERALTNEMLQKRALSTRYNDIGGSESALLAPKGLVILVNYSDLAMTKLDYASADSMLNSDSYHYQGAVGSVRQYFSDQSNGAYTPEFTVVGPVTLAHEHDYYGTNSSNSNGYDQYNADIVIEACLLAEQQGLDFSQFDANNDGDVDFVYIIYAGTGEADSGVSTDVWPKSGELSSMLYYGLTNQTTYSGWNRLRLDGKYIEKFACSNEISGRKRDRDGIGTFCHEYSHVIGLPDIYDSSYGTNYQQGLTPGKWSLMDAGSYNNDGITPPNYAAWDKYFCGWITPQAMKDAKDMTLAVGDCYYIASSLANVRPTSSSTIYYVENRQQTGWDEYLPGHGLLIWQVAFDSYAWEYNYVNQDDLKYALVGSTSYPGTKNIAGITPMENCPLTKIREQNDTVIFQYKGGDGTIYGQCEHYNWTPKAALSSGDCMLGEALWTVTSNQETFGYKGLVGATIGTSTAPSTTFSLLSEEFKACSPTSVSITTKCPNATITASIGGVVIGTTTLGTGKQVCTFNNSNLLSGDIQFSFSNVTTQISLFGLEVSYDAIEEAIEHTQQDTSNSLFFHNGQLLIRSGEHIYDITGKRQQ